MIKRISSFFILFFLCSASPGFCMSVEDVERKVIELFKQSESIPQVRITPAEENRFVIELIFNIGDRWGRDGFVRDLAKVAMTRVFTSGLPVAQGIVKVYCRHTEVIHLAIGMNHVNQISWSHSSSPSEFFDTLRSCVHWGKKPQERTYFIETKQVIKPSPAISFPPNS
jgi:hypothetical protein